MKLNRFLAVFTAVLLVGLSAYAQTTATLNGTVTLAGNPLPGVTVTISSPNMLGTRTYVSDSNGNYVFGAISPGQYTVRFELASMQSVTRTVDVGLSTTARVDTEMRLSAVAESITVTASSPAVLETTEVQTNLNAKLIEELPMSRTIIGTVNLAPGVNQNGPGGATTISGGFAFDSTYYVDGAVVNEVLRGQPQNLFIEDAIQETTVQTGGISAEFGRFTGGVVTAISKSGGNEFSGSIRDNLNNAKWTSQGALNEPRPKSDLVHTWEATLGGRLIRDRVWFFGAGRYYTFEAQQALGTVVPGEVPVNYTRGDEETRLEAKLTGQVTPRHTLVGTWFDIDRTQLNNSFQTSLEPKTLDVDRALPQRFYSINYNGILTNSFLIEATYAKQDFSFVGSGANSAAPPERGTNVSGSSYYGSGNRLGYPTFCGACSFPEERNNQNSKLKGTYFLSTSSTGTHNLTAGYENFTDYLKSDNHQSASDFSLLMYGVDLAGGEAPPPPTRGANGDVLSSTRGVSALIVYWPILISSKGNDFNTSSLFINDKWDVNNRLNLNLGVRYDKNKGNDQNGATVADDDSISPRLGAQFDVFGNGRLRLNGSYSRYASKIANGNVGDAASPAGSPSLLYWGYYGPDLDNLNSDQLLDAVFGWFRSVGFTDNRDFLFGGGTSGIQTKINGTLKSPSVDEITVGVGTQVGSNGFVRVDFQDRKWHDFYTSVTTQETGQVFDPLAGSNLDQTLVENSNEFERTYRAATLQASYRLFNRVNLGGNYTYAELKGNIEGETSGSGPIVTGGSRNYPEYLNFDRNRPEGYLGADQRHKVRAWASIDLPTFVGNFNVSALQSFDSGTPYSAVAVINPTRRSACPTCPANPGYIEPPTSVNYYISDRGEFRLGDLSATNLALNYTLPIGRFQLFAQGEVRNVFDRQTATTVNTSVTVVRSWDPFNLKTLTACTAAQTNTQCAADNPVPPGETGLHGLYRLGANFGKPTTATSGSSLLPGGVNGHLQLPRTYIFSAGFKF
jgi:hypothetical protein